MKDLLFLSTTKERLKSPSEASLGIYRHAVRSKALLSDKSRVDRDVVSIICDNIQRVASPSLHHNQEWWEEEWGIAISDTGR